LTGLEMCGYAVQISVHQARSTLQNHSNRKPTVHDTSPLIVPWLYPFSRQQICLLNRCTDLWIRN